MLTKVIAAFALIPALLSASEFGPWLGTDLVFENRLTVLHQAYRTVNAGKYDFHESANDNFWTIGTSMSLFDYSAKIEATLADTNKQRPAFDNARLTLQYRILNDIIGDPVTLTPGITITQACKHSLHDISSFHHGQIESELHVAVGKEISYEQFWLVHSWAVAGVGIGDHGSPWIRADVNFERNFWDIARIRLFIHSLWGCGGDNLSEHKHFHGYGPISHKSVDVGIRAWYQLDFGLILSAEFAHRIYARNFPKDANLAMFQLLLPVGL